MKEKSLMEKVINKVRYVKFSYKFNEKFKELNFLIWNLEGLIPGKKFNREFKNILQILK